MRNNRSDQDSAPLVIDADYWIVPPPDLSLENGRVHVWLADLNVPANSIDHFRALLSADEHTRSERFHFDKDRNAYITARGMLRTLLARYVGCGPREIEFVYGSRGKPALDGRLAHHPLRFNVSHSGSAVLCVFALDHDVGIDIEQVRSDFAGEKIAKRFFSAAEVEALLATPSDKRVKAFFDCWTRKEAFIKAIGEGLSFPLDQFDVSLAPDRPAALLATRPEPLDAEKWSIHDVKTPPNYAGAVAVNFRDVEPSFWLWPEPRSDA